jgi:hypothetical protein
MQSLPPDPIRQQQQRAREMPIPPAAELDPEAALDALCKLMLGGRRDLDLEVGLYRALLKSPNREAAAIAKRMIVLLIGDGRLELEGELLPADLAELMEEISRAQSHRASLLVGCPSVG